MDFKTFEKFITTANKMCSSVSKIVANGEKILAVAYGINYTATIGMYAPEQLPFIITVKTAVSLVAAGKAIKAKTIRLVDGVAYIDSLKIPYELDGLDEGETIPTIEYGDKLEVNGEIVKRMLDILEKTDGRPFQILHMFIDTANNLFATNGYVLAAKFSSENLEIGDTKAIIPYLVAFLNLTNASFFAIPNNHGCYVTDKQCFILYQLSAEVENNEASKNFTSTGVRKILEPVVSDCKNGRKTIIKNDMINFLRETNTSYYRRLDVTDSFAKIIRINVPSKKNRFHTEDDLTIFEQEIESKGDFKVNGNFLYQLIRVFGTDSVTIYQGKNLPLLVTPNNNNNTQFIGVIMPLSQ